MNPVSGWETSNEHGPRATGEIDCRGVAEDGVFAVHFKEGGRTMKRTCFGFAASAALAALFLCSFPALAQVAPSLGTAESFAVLANQSVSNTGFSVVTGDLGLSPGNISSITGFPPGIVTGTTHAADGVALQAQNDVTTAYNTLAGQAPTATLTGQDLGGMTLTSGVYFYATSAQLTGDLRLDAQGNPNAVFIFQIGSTLTTASGSRVLLVNGAQACMVFWQVGSSATLGTTTQFTGNILAMQSITLNTNANLVGRALARAASVTLDDNDVDCTSPCDGGGPVPTLPQWGALLLAAGLLGFGYRRLRRRSEGVA
jgi:hypothetical protein